MRNALKFLFLILFIANTKNASATSLTSDLISDDEGPIFNRTILKKRNNIIYSSDEESSNKPGNKKSKIVYSSDEEVSDEEVIDVTQQERIQIFVQLVKDKKYTEIKAYPKTTRNIYTKIAKTTDLLNADEIRELSRGLKHRFKYHDRIAELVRDKTPLNELLEFLGAQKDQQPETATPWRNLSKDEKIHQLHLVIGDLYIKNELEPVDTDYFRARNVVIEKKGVTRNRIVEFLNDPTQETTKTIKELVDQFNRSEFHVYRPISLTAFRGHMKRLKEDELLSARALTFIEACTGPTAPHKKTQKYK